MSQIILSSKMASKLFLDHVKQAIASIPTKDDGILISNQVKTSDIIQTYLLSKDDEFHERIFKPIILKESILSEIMSPGSGEITLLLSLFILNDMLPEIISGKHYKPISEDLKLDMECLVKSILKSSRVVDKRSFGQMINRQFSDSRAREIVKYAIKLSGSSRKIVVEKTNKVDTSIVVRDGYRFPIETDVNFTKNRWNRRDVNCVIIDGVVLEISEIHHLLTYASESGEPYIVFARGFSPDVKNTIYVNNRRKTIDVIPVEIPITEETINIFSDLGAVCMCDIISSYKGDLISKSITEKISKVGSISIGDGIISISNKSAKNRVATQVREISKKRSEILEPQNREIFDKRVKCLLSGVVEIKIGQSDLMKSSNLVENIDKFFRSIPSIINNGIIRTHDLEKLLDGGSAVDLHTVSAVKYKDLKYLSVQSLLTSIKMTSSIVESILSTGCILPCEQS